MLGVIQSHTFLFSLKTSVNTGFFAAFITIIQATERAEILFFRGLYQIMHLVLKRYELILNDLRVFLNDI